jgi:hypothetical protein
MLLGRICNIAIGLFSITVFLPCLAHSAATVNDSFESYSYGRHWEFSGTKPKIVNEKSKTGNYSSRKQIQRGSSYRSELRVRGTLSYGKEYWLSANYFIPNEWSFDKNQVLAMQLMGVPDKNLGEKWRNPLMALAVKGDSLRFYGRWDTNRLTKKASGRGWNYSGEYSKAIGKVSKNRWDHIVVRFTLSYKNDGKGRVTVWRNGRQVMDRKGPNAFNDATGPFAKLGMYIPSWRRTTSGVSKRTLFIDDVNFGERLCGGRGSPKWCP